MNQSLGDSIKFYLNSIETMTRAFSWQAFNKVPIVGIMRNISYELAEIIAKNYHAAGLTNLEVTMNSADAEKIISNLVKVHGDKLNIGAGTVCNVEDLERALTAGAQFVVTPIIDEDVIRSCKKNNIPVFPGGYTPTEIYKAWSLGASMVKVFPATRLGPEYIKEILAPLNGIPLMPTGGITKENFVDFLKAGAKGVGIGSHLFPKQMIENNQWEEWRVFLSGFVKQVQLIG